LAATAFVSCANEPSLQEYYVENQQDNKFIAVDVPTSMFTNAEALDENQRATLKSVKKINLLALPVKENKEDYEAEKTELASILKNEKYQLLMKYGSNNRKAEIYFTGDEDAIDEIIVYGYDDAKGVGVARVLGEDMNPQKLMELMKSLQKGDVDVEGLKGITGMFNAEIGE
jgi:plasmid maintenance system killer protein